MSFLNGKQKTKRGKPTESARVNENVILDLWINDDESISWCLSRVNPKDDSKSFRTMHANHALDCVDAISFFLNVLTKAPGFGESDKSLMQRLAQCLDKVVGEFRADTAKSNLSNGETKSLLVSPVR